MRFLLHFADSEVARVLRDGPDLLLAFAAAQVSPLAAEGGATPAFGGLSGEGRGQAPGQGIGHVQRLVLRLARVDATGLDAPPLGDALGRLAAGRLTVAGRHVSTWPVPQQLHSPLQLALDFANGTQLQLAAQGLHAWFDGDPAYRESLAC